ncbi:NCS1 nucleoside transporter family protein-3 [Coleophoma cylindrospora]|uniref:NCS1 nucleoside transporter family protein-3 n=1 Tax=Coleophoma cylindrospora TaxID=1849047 RepID=A0A3D8QFK6_9HELO|nr:NCS1 nucleoside transporter family protein-3 [Coleophoma cylindrospora]
MSDFYDKEAKSPHAAAPEVAEEGMMQCLEQPKESIFGKFLDYIRLDTGNQTGPAGRWSNADLDPTPIDKQVWRSRNFVTYWLCDAVAPGNLRLGSSLVTVGFSWKVTIGIIALGHFLISLAITANSIIGARYHIPYTIQSRASFGFYFSFVMVFIRMLVGFFWYGLNTYTGAECVNAVIIAIWPSFQNVPNHLPESANITTQMMTAYIIYFLIVLPFHYIHPRHLRWFFDVKTIICVPAIFGMLGWACHVSNGGLHTTLMKKDTTLHGSKYAWAFLSGLNSMLGNYGTMAVNINDFARYARNPRMIFVQILVIPLSFMLISFIGIIIAGAASDLYGEEIWDVLTIMSHWTGSSQSRAGAAFVGLSFVLGQLGSNVSANCISAANDLNAMFPEYINLRRGSYLIAFIGAWALTPWNILSSAATLLNFMDGYVIWLAPITGVLLADYYVVHRRSYDIDEMYLPEGKYRYNKYGTNWRAVVAWLMGCVPLIPGFANSINTSMKVSEGALNLYNLGYIFGFCASFVLYSGISILFPPRSTFTAQTKPDDATPEYVA